MVKKLSRPQMTVNEPFVNGGKWGSFIGIEIKSEMPDAVSSHNCCGVSMKTVLHPWQMLLLILAG
jgi:hypothetical protein